MICRKRNAKEEVVMMRCSIRKREKKRENFGKGKELKKNDKIGKGKIFFFPYSCLAVFNTFLFCLIEKSQQTCV
jgi:hypothetical protein